MYRTPRSAFSFSVAAIVLSATMTVLLQSSPTRAAIATETPAVDIKKSEKRLFLACNQSAFDTCRVRSCGARPCTSGCGRDWNGERKPDPQSWLDHWQSCVSSCKKQSGC